MAENPLWQDREWLRRHYVDEGLTMRQMGRVAGCTHTTIGKWLRRHGIPTRTHAENIKLAWERGTYDSDEYRQKLSNASRATWARGTFDTSEYRQKQGDATRAAWVRGVFDDTYTDERLQKMSKSMSAARARGSHDHMYTDEYRQTMGDAMRARGSFTDEHRRKISDAMRTAWARGVFDGAFQSPTTIEGAVVQALEALGVEHESEYRPPGYSRVYDVLVYPDILIEVQGDYWHTRPGAPERDAEKAEWARGQGFVLVELWGHDIRAAMAAGTMVAFVKSHIDAGAVQLLDGR